jgi:hypothetical protein
MGVNKKLNFKAATCDQQDCRPTSNGKKSTVLMFDHTLPHSASDSHLNPNLLSFDGRYGLPNSVREALLQGGQGEAALVIDALLLCGFTAGKVFIFQKAVGKLVELGFTTSRALVRRALNSSVFISQRLQTQRAGRPTKVYHMPAVEGLVKQYANNAMSAADPLEIKDMQSLTHYRQALHREFIRRAPGIYSRAFLGQRLGVSERTTRNYDRRVGIRAIRRLSKENLLWLPDWQKKVQSGKPGLNWLRICYKDGRFFDAPLMVGIALRHLWKASVQGVYFVTQRCNRYVYAPDDDWADYLYLYAHDDERAFADSSDPYGLRRERLTIDPVSATLSVDPKAYQPKSDPVPAWLPPDLAARRVSRNPFLPRRKEQLNH